MPIHARRSQRPPQRTRLLISHACHSANHRLAELLANVAENSVKKIRLLNRLNQVFIATGFQTFRNVIGRAVSGPREYWYGRCVGERLPLANGASGFQSVHHRHLQIHKDKIRVIGEYLLNGDLAIFGVIKFKVAIAQIGSNQGSVVGSIIDNQDAGSVRPLIFREHC
jgi:hypothetical protein